jgi:phospholipid transport system substrate-binding protein
MTARPLPLLSRRGLLVGAAAAVGVAVAPPAWSLDVNTARALIDSAVGDVNAIINSGKSEQAMFTEFEKVFVRYADVPTIARSTLGPAARTASAGELSAFTKAFQGYISRKYGRRFREFIGGQIEVKDARPIKSYYEVLSIAYLRGESPFEVRWHVAEKGGKRVFFNIIIEGVNMLASERTEIGAMLDKRRGDIGALVEDLRKA